MRLRRLHHARPFRQHEGPPNGLRQVLLTVLIPYRAVLCCE